MSQPKSPPPRIDGYTYVEGIGGGGFADVFLFTQHSTGRGVAVKVLRAEHLSPQSLAQFETEARVMAGVSTHPYIVTIHDAGIATDGRPYLAMEHYPQPHFGRRATGGHLPVSEVLRVGVQVASAVETAHRAGILHRDIKPSNILTSAYGDPGLTDFGLAGVQTEGEMSAATGLSYGFSAPEVVLDETATGSISTDVYALGATIFALLTGRSPVFVPGGDNSTATLARRVTTGELQPVRRDDLPRSLEHLLRSALSARPTDRPTSAADLAAALRSIEQELRLPATPLVLTGGPHRPPAERSTASEDGTRRKPRVVDIDGGTAPSREPQSPIYVAPPSPPAATAGLHAPTDAHRYEAATVARSSSAPPPAAVGSPTPLATAPEGESSGSAPVSTGKYLATGGVVLALLLLVTLAIVFGSGGSDPEERSTPATRPSTIPPPSGNYIATPEDVTMTLEPDGSITVAWSVPTNQQDAEKVEYSVFRSDLPDEPVLATVQALTATIGPGLEPNERGEVCVKVDARLDSDASPTPSDQACIEVASDTGSASGGTG